jgi:hypothetical protein
MERRIYHGIHPSDLSHAVLAEFNRGNLHTRMSTSGNTTVVQIATRPGAPAGGDTAISVTFQKFEDGTLVQVGQQAWMGVAASLGKTALATMLNPWNLINRLDDLAQDLENLKLAENVWKVVDRSARQTSAKKQVASRLSRVVCEYCDTANEVGAGSCVACGAPMGSAQPRACRFCGFVILRGERACPNCKKSL